MHEEGGSIYLEACLSHAHLCRLRLGNLIRATLASATHSRARRPPERAGASRVAGKLQARGRSPVLVAF